MPTSSMRASTRTSGFSISVYSAAMPCASSARQDGRREAADGERLPRPPPAPRRRASSLKSSWPGRRALLGQRGRRCSAPAGRRCRTGSRPGRAGRRRLAVSSARLRRTSTARCGASTASAASGLAWWARNGLPSASAAQIDGSRDVLGREPRHLAAPPGRPRPPGRSSSLRPGAPTQAGGHVERLEPAEQRGRLGARSPARTTSASTTSPPELTAADGLGAERLVQPVQERAELEELEQPLDLGHLRGQHGVVEVHLHRHVAPEQHHPGVLPHPLLVLGQRRPQLGRLGIEVLVDPVDAAVGRDQLGRRLLADAGHARQVVARVAPQRGVLRVLRRA